MTAAVIKARCCVKRCRQRVPLRSIQEELADADGWGRITLRRLSEWRAEQLVRVH